MRKIYIELRIQAIVVVNDDSATEDIVDELELNTLSQNYILDSFSIEDWQVTDSK